MISTAQQNYYELLGVDKNASAAELKRAYFAKIRQFPNETHPEEFKLITKAYQTLLDPEKKRQYDVSLHDNGAYSKLLAALENAIDQEQYQTALYQALNMLKKYPDDIMVQLYLAMSNLGLNRLKEALGLLTRLNSQEPKNEDILFYLGITYNRMERYTAAKAQFRQLVQLNPAEANYQLQLSNTHFYLKEYDSALDVLETYLNKRENVIHDFKTISQLYLMSIYSDRSIVHSRTVYKLLKLAKTEEERETLIGLLIDLCEDLGNEDKAYKDLVNLIQRLNQPYIPEVGKWLKQAEARIRRDLIYFGDAQPQEQQFSQNNPSSSRHHTRQNPQPVNSSDGRGSLLVSIILGIICSSFLTPIGGIVIGAIWYYNAKALKQIIGVLLVIIIVLIIIGVIIASNM